MTNCLKQYITFGKFNINEVLPFITDNKRDKKIYIVNNKPFIVRMDSIRYKVFAQNLSCAKCNIKGSFFLLQQTKDEFVKKNIAHFNFYAEKSDGELILMTKDHIIPKSKGGKDSLDNFRTMCSPCNNKRGNNIDE